MDKVEYIEVKIGNSKRLILKDGILQEKNLEVLERKQGLMSDVVMTALVCLIFGKNIGIMMGLNSLVSRVVKYIV